MKNILSIIKKHACRVGLLLFLGAFIFMLLRNCAGCDCEKCADQTTDTIIYHDTIPGDAWPDTVFIPKPIYRDTGKIKYFVQYQAVDTVAIIIDYLTENHYSVVLKDDTSAYVEYRTSVWMNELQEGQLIFQNRRPIAVNTTIIQPGVNKEAKFKMFLGGSVGGWTDHISISPEIYFNINRSHLIGAGYDIVGNSLDFHYACKISFKKKKNK